MLAFATEFPLDKRQRVSDFLVAIREWILRSPHTVFGEADLQGIENAKDWRTSRGSEALEAISHSSDSSESAALRYLRTDRRLEWATTIVFSRSQSDSWVGIRVLCESMHPAARLPPAKKPVLVRSLLESMGGAADGLLRVQGNAHRLDNVDIDIAAKLILGHSGSRLPIVYVSAAE